MCRTAAIPALLSLALVARPAPAQETRGPEPTPKAVTSAPDFVGMTTYVVGFLLRGPKWTASWTPELREAHIAHHRMMAEVGKVIVGGSCTDGGRILSMSIFRATSVDEVKVLAEADPAVVSGRLKYEWHLWSSMKGIGVCPMPAPDKE